MPEDFTSSFLDAYFKAHSQKMQAQQFQAEQAYHQQDLQLRQQQETAQQQYQQGMLSNANAEQQFHLKDLASREADRQSASQLGLLRALGHDGEYTQAAPGDQQSMNIGGMLIRPKTTQEISQEKLVQQETARQLGQQDLVNNYGDFVKNTESILGRPIDPTTKANVLAQMTGGKEGGDLVKALGLTPKVSPDNSKETPGEYFTRIDKVLTNHIADTVQANPHLMDDPKFAAQAKQLMQNSQSKMMGFQAASAATQVAPGVVNRTTTDTESKKIAQEIGPVDFDKDFEGAMTKYAKVASSGKYAPESLKAYLGTQVVKDPTKKNLLLGLFGVGQ